MKRNCDNCGNEHKDIFAEPCSSCDCQCIKGEDHFSEWVPKNEMITELDYWHREFPHLVLYIKEVMRYAT